MSDRISWLLGVDSCGLIEGYSMLQLRGCPVGCGQDLKCNIYNIMLIPYINIALHSHM